MNKVTIYTDGSCNNWTHENGGYGFVLINGSIRKFCGGSYSNTTSARMEILAIIKALKKCNPGDKIVVYSDNQYAVNTIEKGWIFLWKKENWRGRKNKDLWEMFLKEFSRLHGNIKLKWIRGHDGTYWNEVADILANRGAHRKTKIKDL